MEITHTWTARCCREWEVLPLVKVGRCGYCKERPKVVSYNTSTALEETDD